MNRIHKYAPKRLSWILLAALAAPAANAAVFKIAVPVPDGTAWMQEMRSAGKVVETETGGRVKFKFYPGGVMGNYRSVLRKMRIGQLHGGAFTSGVLAEFFPDAQIYSIPFLFNNHKEVDYVRQRVDPLIVDGLKKNGIITFGVIDTGFAYLMSDKPLRTSADIKDRKVWVPEGDIIGEAILRAAGVAPIPVPLGDVYTALQTGLLDTVANSAVGTIALQWHTKVTYVTDIPLIYLVSYFALDAKAFNKLSAEDQKVLTRVFSASSQKLDRLAQQDDREARAALKKQGLKFIAPEASELQQWRSMADGARKSLAKDAAYSEAMYRIIAGHLEAFRAQQPAGR
ncbi:MAG: TRAP transporter substrate-binding protein DctP [Gammaproteobacteria bacterium]|jgi:TRAP-type C4-dicarboxylate transport system substrate-binding protein|nr:TRAP transporter substrate-binding protein DctP [Gammaproteobacteria bacterium]